ncbi:hypothetical protein Mth01_42610 [Sphaerimonospora thailandensis]|uniref:Transposase IS4 N-terminal domain-containing protein n=1 Tax=Sphaerimonospora thailandensis TaxID=795644 RepID=A0A8J3RBJ8_9ACTN|nr:hypothetical protein Mth01_42610 [Sphaerimonospora thailandensis]
MRTDSATTTTLTRTLTVAGGVFAPGHLGELTQHLPFELVDAVLEDAGKIQRRLRNLPSRVGVYVRPVRRRRAVSQSRCTEIDVLVSSHHMDRAAAAMANRSARSSSSPSGLGHGQRAHERAPAAVGFHHSYTNRADNWSRLSTRVDPEGPHAACQEHSRRSVPQGSPVHAETDSRPRETLAAVSVFSRDASHPVRSRVDALTSGNV